MSNNTVEYKFNGAPILFEVENNVPLDNERPVAIGRLGDALLETNETFNLVLAKISAMADSITDAISTIKTKPTEIGLEFGIKIGVESNIYVVKGSGEGHLNFTIKWKPE